MTNGDLWDLVHVVLKKESRGNILKPSEFSDLLRQCHLEYYNQQYEKWAASQTAIDSMQPFVELDEIQTITLSKVALADLDYDYQHLIAARRFDYALGQTWFNQYDIVTPRQWTEWQSDPVMVASSLYPILTVDNTNIHVAGHGDDASIYLSYLRK